MSLVQLLAFMVVRWNHYLAVAYMVFQKRSQFTWTLSGAPAELMNMPLECMEEC